MRFSCPIAVASLALVAAASPAQVLGASPRDLEDSIKAHAYHAADYGANQAVDAAIYGKHQVKHAGNSVGRKGHGAADYAHEQADGAEDYADRVLEGEDDEDDDDDDSDDYDEGESGREQGQAAEEYAQEQADAASDHASRVAAHHHGSRDPARHKGKKTESIYDYDFTPGIIESASHWLETKTAAYAYRALPTGAAHKRAFRRRASSSPSGGSAASGFYQFASSFAGLPQYSGKNGNYASATAKANPTFHNGGQQQQRPLTVPQSQIGASPSVSESTASPQTARPLTKRYGAYHDIGDDAASYGTQQATDAVASVSNMLYGDDYAWGLAKRQSAIPSPTSAAAPESTDPAKQESVTNGAASRTRGGNPYYGIDICVLACAAAVFAGALL